MFKSTLQNFDHFFSGCAQGLCNEILINMYFVTYLPEQIILNQGFHVENVYFLKQGRVNLRLNMNPKQFFVYPQYSVFGDYQCFFNMKTHALYVADAKRVTSILQITKKAFLKQMSYYPESLERCK